MLGEKKGGGIIDFVSFAFSYFESCDPDRHNNRLWTRALRGISSVTIRMTVRHERGFDVPTQSGAFRKHPSIVACRNSCLLLPQRIWMALIFMIRLVSTEIILFKYFILVDKIPEKSSFREVLTSWWTKNSLFQLNRPYYLENCRLTTKGVPS